MANPEIIEASDEDVTYEEGCLSVPEHYSDVVRPAKVTVRYLDRDGETKEMACEGLLATCVQHEIDHLDGILFIDHISVAQAQHDPAQAPQGAEGAGARRGRGQARQARRPRKAAAA